MRLASIHAVHHARALVRAARQAVLDRRYAAFRAAFLEKFHSGETLARAAV
jgi:queuine/archaeosine tRNA-ribosyltransferase